ncbi:hypothetical protein BDD43_2153 [Mucilaginibacter gracilis]|uniref:Uncharacterized protein n=1 Tax=Mucilaginibacter gracilis TaxID=423350 RepID=A0A495J1L9_9SPHI|nr:hypothetical protein [Mucilaginibacter gracilis]RKR81989.1 hypothetical protein BDD43_2153 [Mucilaginibacter gracilis]
MNDKEEKIPLFVKDYLNKMEYEGYPDFVKLSRDYFKEREDYPGKYAEQAAHLNDHNRRTGQNRQLNYEDGLKGIDTRYKQSAYQTAKQHGYKGPDPNKPSDKQFTKQGEKFQGMIDNVRKRQTEREQNQEALRSHEKKNIETLKAQNPYKQEAPKVEFKDMEQPSGTKQQSKEQQRAAFLEQVKKTREQQTQIQPGKQPEI